MKTKRKNIAFFTSLAAFLITATAATALTVTNAPDERAFAETPFFVSEVTYDTTGITDWYTCVPTVQGENNFFALYGKAEGTYFEMTSPDADASGNHWKGGAQYNGIDWRQEFGPDGGNDAILAWRAPFNGTVQFQGKVAKNNMEGSDGIVLKAYTRKSPVDPATELYKQTYTDPFEAYFSGEAITVTSGEIFFFSIDQNNTSANDSAKLYLKTNFTKDSENPGSESTGGVLPQPDENPEECIFNNYPNYTLGEQAEYYAAPTVRGENNLYALYGKADGVYAEMANENNGNHWQGSAQYNNIWWRQEFGPDGGDDAIIAWRAPFNGTVKFTGKIFKDNMSGSDGVRIKAYNRKSLEADAEEIYNRAFTDVFTIYFNGCDIEVASGEIYYFSVDQNGTSANDATKVWMKTEFTKNETNAGTETPSAAPIVPEYHGDSSSIFNDKLGYVLGGQGEYYAAPTEQGSNNLWILYGKTDNLYAEMKADPDQAAGNHWSGKAQYNGVWWRQEFAPDGGDDVILAWRAPFNGTVKFTGKIFKNDLTGSGSDGVRIKAYNRKSLSVEPEEIYNEAFTQNFTIYFNGCDIAVESGEIYYFAVDQYLSSAFDTTNVWMKAEFTKDEANPGEEAAKEIGAREVDYTGFYGTEQGENGWYYAQGSIEKYAYMDYGVSKNSGELCWNGVDDWHRITADNMSPGTKFGALRIYVVPKNGVISILGALNKTGDGGDGLNAKIYLNGEAIFEHSFGKSPASAALPKSLRYLSVKAGDLIVYYTDCGGNGSNAYDNITFACEIFTESETGEAIENPSAYLNPVHKLELQGVNLPEPDLDENEDYTDEVEGGGNGCNGSIAFGAGGAALIAAIALTGVALKKKKSLSGRDKADKGGRK